MDTLTLLKSHRTIRKYTDRPIDPKVMSDILECGCRASNTGNMQIYSIVVTQEYEARMQLAKQHFGQGSTAPAYLTICVDVNRYHHWCRLNGCQDEPYNNLLWLMSGTVDASLCAQNICVAAEAYGLGICYLGTVMYNTKAIAEILQLPKGVVPVITISMGYPAEEQHLSERLPLDGVVHYEQYHQYSDDEIRDIHRVREEFPFNQEMVRQNEVENLAKLFTCKRYPKNVNLAVSQSLMQYFEEADMLHDS